MNPPDQPIGEPLPEWTARQAPPRTDMEGRLCRVEPLDPARHARALFEAMLARRTRLGLLSEHIDPANGELWK